LAVPIRTDNSPEVLDLSVRIHADNNTNHRELAVTVNGHMATQFARLGLFDFL